MLLAKNTHIAALVAAAFLVSIRLQQPTGGDDSVVLKNGGQVDGVIIEETAASVTLEVAPGARIEVFKSEITKIHRAERTASRPAAASKPAPGVEFNESWWIVRNASGEFAGTRHLTSGPDPRNAQLQRFEEILELRDDDGKKLRISRLELADAEGRPRECQYREVYEGGSSHVNAAVNGKTLDVETIDCDGRQNETLPFGSGATFPLLFQDRARRAPPAAGGAFESEVYDPFVRTLARRAVRAEAAQSIAIANETPAFHNVLIMTTRGIDSVMWAGRSGDIVRMELNGPDLVATKSTRAEAEAAETAVANASWIARDASGRIKLLLPTPDWHVDRVAMDAVSMSRQDGAATVLACALDVESDTTPAGAATSFERRLRSTLQKFQRTGEFTSSFVGKAPATRFEFQYTSDKGVRSGFATVAMGKTRAYGIIITFNANDRERIERETLRLLNRADVGF